MIEQPSPDAFSDSVETLGTLAGLVLLGLIFLLLGWRRRRGGAPRDRN